MKLTGVLFVQICDESIVSKLFLEKKMQNFLVEFLAGVFFEIGPWEMR